MRHRIAVFIACSKQHPSRPCACKPRAPTGQARHMFRFGARACDGWVAAASGIEGLRGSVPKNPFAWIGGRGHFSNAQATIVCGPREMPDMRVRLRDWVLGFGVVAALASLEPRAAGAAKIKMVFPGPVTTFSLPYLVA